MQHYTKESDWIPDNTTNHEGKERNVGVELEFSGVEPKMILECIVQCFNGSIEKESVFKYQVRETEMGGFTLELDAQLLQSIVSEHDQVDSDDKVYKIAENLLKTAAEQLVPWEVVAPPIKVSNLYKLTSLFNCLRKKGALGTRHAARYAFGLHLNPELPNFKSNTLVQYMQAYLCLYDWIYYQEKIDLTRKISPYIDHFKKDYILKVVDKNYQPDSDSFIEDYIEHNPTRNRSLDLLPLFAHLNKKWIKNLKEKDLVKARPTFHYRLPNCDIDNPDWNLDCSWKLWLKVEQLANQPKILSLFINEFREDYQRFGRAIDNKWVNRCDELIAQHLQKAADK